MEKFTVTVDFTEAQAGFTHNELVFVIDKDDANFRHYGRIANQTAFLQMKSPRKDWYELLIKNKPFEPEYLIVDFGSYDNKWSKLYHVSQLVNVRLLGQKVLTAFVKGS